MSCHVLPAKGTTLLIRENVRGGRLKRVQQVRAEKRLSFYDARKLVETFQSAMVATSYVAVVKTPSRNVSVNTDITWRHYETQDKQIDTEKQVKKHIQKQRKVAHKKKQTSTDTISTTMSQMSLASSNPSSRSSTGMPVPSLPKTRKDKSPSTDRSSGRTKKAEQNAIQTSNKFDVLDDGGDERDISSLHHPTTKPQSKL